MRWNRNPITTLPMSANRAIPCYFLWSAKWGNTTRFVDPLTVVTEWVKIVQIYSLRNASKSVYVNDVSSQPPSLFKENGPPVYLVLGSLSSISRSTLTCLIAEHARLTILENFSSLLALIRHCSLNYFPDIFFPACLLGSWICIYIELFSLILVKSKILFPTSRLSVHPSVS